MDEIVFGKEEITEEDILETRKDFDKKISAIMKRYGYTDIYEGTREPVTEKASGTIRLFYSDGKYDVWIYQADYKKHKVILVRNDE